MKIRRHITYANVVATICLLIVAGPSISWAAGQLRSADIQDGSLTGQDVKNGSLSARDLSRSTRRALTDTSPWEKIPKGTLVTGAFNYAYTVRGGGDIHVEPIQLPARPSRTFPVSAVNFAPDGNSSTIDDDASCTGTFARPTAPAGKICLYLGAELASDQIQGVGAEFASMRAKGLFNLFWNDDSGSIAGQSNEIYGSWAYRAP